jgi:hypothetical protein
MCQSRYLVKSPKTGHFVRMDDDGNLILSLHTHDVFCEHMAPVICDEARHKFYRRFVFEEVAEQPPSSVETQLH